MGEHIKKETLRKILIHYTQNLIDVYDIDLNMGELEMDKDFAVNTYLKLQEIFGTFK